MAIGSPGRPPVCKSHVERQEMIATHEYQQFIGGAWTPAAGGATFEDCDPFTGDVVATVPAAGPARRRGGDRRGGGRVRGLARDSAGRAAAHLPEGRRPARGASRRGRGDARARDRLDVRVRHVPVVLRPEPLPAGGRARVRADRTGHPVRHGCVRDGHPAPGRRRRRVRALERSAHPLGALDRGAARARQHRRAEAVRVVAVDRRPALGARSSPRPGCPTASSTSSRTRPATPARSATSSIEHPGRAAAQLHRLERGRPPASPRRPAGT